MFNFLVTSVEITEPRGSFVLGHDRVFQFTDPDLRQRFAPDRVLNDAALLELPTVITNESGWDRERSVFARVGKLTKVRRGPGAYNVEYTLDADIPPIPNSLLEQLAPQLHFDLNTRRGFGDFGTNHWAVKDADLFRVLFAEGVGRVKPNVFSLPNEPATQDLVSVMMPFDANFNRVYGALQQAAVDAGMRCLRADDMWDHDTIIQDVVKLISTARVVICDLSRKNANVFYEAGIAHTLGKEVILLAQHESDVPFDLRHIRYINYLPNDEGLATLVPKVSDRLRELVNRQAV
jgi:hypothetical protein